MPVLAHVGGVPLEEALLSLGSVGASLSWRGCGSSACTCAWAGVTR